MDWLAGRAPRSLRSIATTLILAVVLLLVFFGLLRLLGEASGLVVSGVIAVGIAMWELTWERPRRQQRRLASLQTRQRAPGKQSLHSDTGARHWTDRLPTPLAAVAASTPISLFTVGILVVAYLGASALLDSGATDARLHAPLAVGSAGEVKPLQAGKDRLKVAILEIAEGADVDVVTREPAPGMKFWAIEMGVENTGDREFQAPAWKLIDSDGLEHEPAVVVGGETAPFPLEPGDSTTRWVVFEIPEEATPQQLRVIPAVRHEALIPREVSFDAE